MGATTSAFTFTIAPKRVWPVLRSYMMKWETGISELDSAIKVLEPDPGCLDPESSNCLDQLEAVLL